MLEDRPGSQLDAALPPELIEIYHTEIIERSRRLASGARQLALGRLSAESISDLTRDAHTIKGSSRVMGLAEMGNAGALLEQAWKAIESGSVTATATVGRALEQLASMLPDAAEQEQQGMTARLRDLVVRTEKVLQGGGPHEDSLPLRVAADSEGQESIGPTSLGGLLAAVERSMLAGTSRVDTIDLYQLINQAVEVSLDADALSDLALVQFEGADPQRLMTAWRSQLRRMSVAVGQLQALAVSLANAPLRQATDIERASHWRGSFVLCEFGSFARLSARSDAASPRFSIAPGCLRSPALTSGRRGSGWRSRRYRG